MLNIFVDATKYEEKKSRYRVSFLTIRNVGFAAIAQSKPVPNQKKQKAKAVQKHKSGGLSPLLFYIVPMQGSNGLRRCAHA